MDLVASLIPLPIIPHQRGRMAGMAIEFNENHLFAPKVLAILQDCGPLRSKDIAREARRRGFGQCNQNTINKVLTQYLADSVLRMEDGQWVAKPSPSKTISPSAH